MKFLALQPFVPSGTDFDKSKQFFIELGFNLRFENAGLAGFEKDGCRFMLQHFDAPGFAENFMISVAIDNAIEFRNSVIDKKLPEKYGIRIGEISQQPYGKDVTIIDIAGVCWHFVE